MIHKYKYHVDVRDESGFYLGALTYVLRPHARELDICSTTLTVALIKVGGAYHVDTPLPPVVVRQLRIPLTLWTICQRGHGTILWSQRDCIVVTPADFILLVDDGYVVLYNEDPFIDDTRDWVTSFMHAQHRRDQ